LPLIIASKSLGAKMHFASLYTFLLFMVYEFFIEHSGFFEIYFNIYINFIVFLIGYDFTLGLPSWLPLGAEIDFVFLYYI